MPADPVAVAVCTTPTCAHRGQHHPIHADTVQPVHCGGCFTVLHCDHTPETVTTQGGTLGNPLEHTVTTCTRCGTELHRDTRTLPPVDLANLPITVLTANA